MPFIDLFLDMMPSTVVAVPGFMDNQGTFIASGVTESLRCRIEGKMTLVEDAGGRMVQSTARVFVHGVHGLTSDRHRYHLPSPPYDPSEERTAIIVVPEFDELGPCYETVYLS